MYLISFYKANNERYFRNAKMFGKFIIPVGLWCKAGFTSHLDHVASSGQHRKK